MRNEIEDRPFEKSIVQSIREARTQKHFAFCAEIIKRTTLRFNHDQIVAAFAQALTDQGIADPNGGDFGVTEHVRARKPSVNDNNA